MIRSFSLPFTTSPSIHCSMRRSQRLSSHWITAAVVHRQVEMHEWTKMLPQKMWRLSIPWGFTKSSATSARLQCVLSCMVLARAVPTSGSPRWEMHWWRWKSATFCASTGRREVHCRSEFNFFFFSTFLFPTSSLCNAFNTSWVFLVAVMYAPQRTLVSSASNLLFCSRNSTSTTAWTLIVPTLLVLGKFSHSRLFDCWLCCWWGRRARLLPGLAVCLFAGAGPKTSKEMKQRHFGVLTALLLLLQARQQ